MNLAINSPRESWLQALLSVLYALSGRKGKVVASHAVVARSISAEAGTDFYIICTRCSGGSAHYGGGATSQLDLLSLTPLSVASFGRLQQQVAY